MKNLATGALLITLLLSWQCGAAAIYPLPPPEQHTIGAITTVVTRYEDTLLDIARAHGIGYADIVAANPDVDPWLPGEDTRVLLPTRYLLPDVPRKGLVLNVPEMRLYYFPTPGAGESPVVMTFPVSVGRMDWSTPLGVTQVVQKARNPSWYPPASVRKEAKEEGRELPGVVPAGPDNPLGAHALRLGIPGYLIHGTNRPAGVGMRVTHGCVRMYPEDIAFLFEKVPVGTPVRIINQPWKMGWDEKLVYLEAHDPLEEDRENAEEALTVLTRLVVAATREREAKIDWDVLEDVYRQSLGLPVATGTRPGVALAVADVSQLDGWCEAGAASQLCATQPLEQEQDAAAASRGVR
jgi:L,D-transpeptidase ErfK/SrfK